MAAVIQMAPVIEQMAPVIEQMAPVIEQMAPVIEPVDRCPSGRPDVSSKLER
jgi:hypothetical protein